MKLSPSMATFMFIVAKNDTVLFCLHVGKARLEQGKVWHIYNMSALSE